MDSLDKLMDYGKRAHGLSIKFKDKSAFMKILGKILFFNPKFMSEYITTIGKTVYFPTEESFNSNRGNSALILAHELVHINDSSEVGSVSFSYSYLFPQVLSLLAFFAIFSSNLWLLCLFFLLPAPAPFRTFWELRGYAMSDAVAKKITGDFLPMEFISKQFTTGAYFFMWPFKNDIERRIGENRELIVSGKITEKIGCEEVLKCF